MISGAINDEEVRANSKACLLANDMEYGFFTLADCLDQAGPESQAIYLPWKLNLDKKTQLQKTQAAASRIGFFPPTVILVHFNLPCCFHWNKSERLQMT